jgi:hypothetical protein
MWSRIIIVALWFSLAALFVLAAAGCASPMRERATIDLAQHQAEVANLKLQCVEAMLKLDAIYRRATAGETLQ